MRRNGGTELPQLRRDNGRVPKYWQETAAWRWESATSVEEG